MKTRFVWSPDMVESEVGITLSLRYETPRELKDWTPIDNVFCATGKGGGVKPDCGKGKSKFVGAIVGKAEHVRAAKIEQEVAKAVRGKYMEDNEFYDVGVGNNYIEVKSMPKGSATQISVHPDALLRKVDGIKQTGGTFHTVVVDDRKTYQKGAYSENYSGHRMYYKRGSGRYSLSQMHQVSSEAELRYLIKSKTKDLPEKAQGSLPSKPTELLQLRQLAKGAHAARLAKDRARKARLKAAGTSAYERQT